MAISKEDTVLEILPSHPADKSREHGGEPYRGRVAEPYTQNVPPPSFTHSKPIQIVPNPLSLIRKPSNQPYHNLQTCIQIPILQILLNNS